ncbi:uncharacterized protein LOC121418022 [Lytechinus variegatus]|uniref:uncharacterized protein LOC121418022 n=1 Tax=Lytechinus variegatus TaxID=7654 RepID=UPI001BB1DC4F|nr:uncharacterized protein LOC121418022 [Lytechinus variegatus]
MARNSDQDASSLCHIGEENEEDGILRCQLNISRTNIKVLGESIVNLSQEVENALLRSKWSTQLKVDEGIGKEQIQSPIEDTISICTELNTSSECFEDVSAALKQRESSLQETVKALTKEIADLKDT